jgi:probable HAF family extracellular repeat protein
VNSNGQIVGWASTPSAGQRAFLYENGTLTDLNTVLINGTGWTLRDAYAINDSAQIVGEGTSPSGYNHAFLLAPVPEPSTFALLPCLFLLRRARINGRARKV